MVKFQEKGMLENTEQAKASIESQQKYPIIWARTFTNIRTR